MSDFVQFFKVSSLPGTLAPNTFYFVLNGDYAESYLTTTGASPVAKAIGNSAMIQDLAGGSGVPEVKVASTITAMLALAPTQNSIIYVTNATTDTTVSSGGATYIYNHAGSPTPVGPGGIDGRYIKIAEDEFTVDWSIITSKPTSTAAQIDAAVSQTATNTSAISTLQSEVNTTQTGAGLGTGGEYIVPTGSLFLDTATSLHDATLLLDAAIGEVDTAVTSLGNVFNYVGTVSGGADSGTAFDLSTLPASQKDTGDYFKVAAAGWFRVGAGSPFYANLNDGLVWNTSAGIDIIDNTNATVTGTSSYIAVAGTSETGFTVDIDSAFKSRMTAVETAAAHSNRAVLDKLGEQDGNLTYDGAKVTAIWNTNDW